MKFLADLHIHSRFSRATSKNLTLEQIYISAAKKGIKLIGTGDFLHKGWLDEIEEKLEPAGNGFFRLKKELKNRIKHLIPKTCNEEVFFALSVEISNIYSKGGKVRKVHNVCMLPDIDSVKKFREKLARIGNLDADGRPILGLDSKKLLEILLEVNEQGIFIPAHIWTPWFSVLGSKSGFDSIEECFEDLTPYIDAVETGLSSDPEMNWACDFLDDFTLVSNSDAHSADKIGREANLFDSEFSYQGIKSALKKKVKSDNKLIATVEFFPEEGKYHHDGHRKCNINLSPEETIKLKGICPVCKKPLTRGVLYRVYELKSRKLGEKPPIHNDFFKQIPLKEIISEIVHTGVASKKVQSMYETVISKIGGELFVLLEAPIEELKKVHPLLAEGIRRMRQQEVFIQPGFDGTYGIIRVFKPRETREMVMESFFTTENRDSSSKKKHTQIKKKKEEEFDLFKAMGMNASAKEGRAEKEDNKQPQSSSSMSKSTNFTPEQEAILKDDHKIIIVNAGPGSGKTHILTNKILQYHKSNKTSGILAITFTVKAAGELQTRILNSFDTIPENIKVGTFHAICLEILKTETKFSAKIIDDSEKFQIAREFLGIKKPASVLKNISLIKQKVSGISEPNFDEYQRFLEKNNLIDIDDVILNTVNLFQKQPEILEKYRSLFNFILVDEFQDLNPVQYEFIKLLASGKQNKLFVIGDPNQSIYAFRGASPEFFFKLKQDFEKNDVKEFSLSINFRSEPAIVHLSTHFINSLSDWKNINFSPVKTGKLKVKLFEATSLENEVYNITKTIESLTGGISLYSIDKGDAQEDTKEYFKDFSDIAIIVRSHNQIKPIADSLSKAQIPYRISGEDRKILENKELSLIIALIFALTGNASFLLIRKIARFFDKDIVFNQEKLETAVPENKTRLISEIKKHLFSNNIKEFKSKVFELFGFEKFDENHPVSIFFYSIAANNAKLHDVPALLSSVKPGEFFKSPGSFVNILTAHASKGLEFEVVFIPNLNSGIFPLPGIKQHELKEEARLFYVAMTRAKTFLYLSYNKKRTRSPFLNHLDPEFVEKISYKPKKKIKKEEQYSLF